MAPQFTMGVWVWLANFALLFPPLATQDSSIRDIFVKALVGTEVVLPCECSIAGKLHPTDPPQTPFDVHWFRNRESRRTPVVSKWTNGTQVHFGDWTSSEVRVNESSLRIYSLAYPRDHGKFVCSIENDVAVTVNVLAPVREVSIVGSKIVDDETIVDVSAGKSNIVTCRTYANPIPVFRWSIGARQIDGAQNVPTDNPHTGSLRFLATKNMHGRLLRCRAKNDLSNFTETAVKLSVLYKPTVTSVSSDPSITVVEGDSLTLRCEANGNPTPTFSWRQGITGSAAVISNGDSYHIAAVELTQAGGYRCTATNAEGRSSRIVRINVQRLPKFSVRYDRRIHTLVCITEFKPSNTSFGFWEQKMGDTVIQRQGQLIRNTNVLRLSPLTYEDTGFYLCTATSGTKKIRSSSFNVQPETKPVFQLDQQTSYLAELGSTLNIRILYYVYPNRTSVRWVMLNLDQSTYVTDRTRTEKQEAVNVVLTFHGTVARIGGTAAILTLDSIEQSDEGNYSLIVTNSMGKSTFRFSVSMTSYDIGSSSFLRLGPVGVVGIVVGASLVVILIVVLVLVKCGQLPHVCRTKSRYHYSPPREGTHVDTIDKDSDEPDIGTFHELSLKDSVSVGPKDDVNRNLQM